MVVGGAGGVVGENEKEFKIFNYELGMKIEDVPCEFSLEFSEIFGFLPFSNWPDFDQK